MWKPEKSPRSTTLDEQDSNGNGIYEDAKEMFAHRESVPTTLDELRGQGGFGVLVAASDLKQPGTSTFPNIGARFTSELDAISRRERQVLDIQDLATHRVLDLTADQLRQILEFMV